MFLKASSGSAWKDFILFLRPWGGSLSLIIIVSIIICVFPGAVFGEDSSNKAALYLWRFINEARANPKEIIYKLGIDETAARAALGEDQWILDQGLPPLAWNGSLAQAATGHCTDMIENLYYSSTGLDGSHVADRIAATGYMAASSGETLGLTAFVGFMKPLKAAQIMFDNWVQDELDPARGGVGKRIFNPGFTEMGAVFKGVVLDLGDDIPPNIYVVAADFAQPLEQRAYILGSVYMDANGDRVMELGGCARCKYHCAKLHDRGRTRDCVGCPGFLPGPIAPGFLYCGCDR